MKNNKFPGQTGFYQGKVRNVYTIGSVAVAETSSRISAFDKILPFEINNKGAMLNLISAYFMEKTRDIVPNCLLAVPTPNTSIWLKTTPFKIELVVRGYNVGTFYRQYYKAKKPLPWDYDFNVNLKEYEKLPENIVTPTTKATEGHDEDISIADILEKGLATENEWEYLKDISLKLFARGQEMADAQGLILLDTKFEFGKGPDGMIYLVDELFTSDSSRYLYKEGYEESLKENKVPKALSKEFVRQYLMDNGFEGKEGQVIPEFSNEKKIEISERYKELYNQVTGSSFEENMKSNFGDQKDQNDEEIAIILAVSKIKSEKERALVSIVMGSDSDLDVMKKAAIVLAKAGVTFELGIVSAHRTPEWVSVFGESAVDKGIKVIIAGAGGAAHLPGMVAANTILPVIGVPVKSASNPVGGIDSLLSILQMPAGVPVATAPINGAENAGLLALQILALSNPLIKGYLEEYKEELKKKVKEMQIKVDETYYFSLT